MHEDKSHDSWPRRPRVLLVEDDEVTRYLLVRWLTSQAYDVDGVHDAEVARERLAENTYDAIVTDHDLGLSTGLELLVHAVSAGHVAASQVVIVSGAPPEAEAAAHGFAVLRKPVSLDRLVEQVERLILSVAPKPATTTHTPVQLVLYVSSGSAASTRAQRTAWRIVAQAGPENVRLEIRDVADHPLEALEHRVSFTPTLLRLEPAPRLRIIGDLRDEGVVRDAMAVWTKST